MKRLLLIAAVILAFTGSNMTWIERPVLSGVNAFNIHMIPGFGYSPSFGITAILLSALLLAGIFIRSSYLRIWVGIAGVMLSIIFFANVAFLDPARFKAISDEVDTYQSVMTFSRAFLPPNLGIEPAYSLDIKPEQLMDRLQFIWHIMGWGWFIFTGGTILWLLIVGKKEWFKKNIVYIILALLISSIPSVPYMVSKYYIGKANAHWSDGNYNRAVEEFESAKDVNPALGYSRFYNVNLGRMYYYLGRGDNFYYYLYTGMVYDGERRTTEAEDAYLKAVEMSRGTPSSAVIRNQYTDFLIRRGLFELRRKRSGTAQAYLGKAVEITPDNFSAHYILAKVLYDISQFEQAIAVNKYILQISMNPMLNANVNANIGDCYSKLGEYNRAREFYEIALELDRYANFRVFEDLGGT